MGQSLPGNTRSIPNSQIIIVFPEGEIELKLHTPDITSGRLLAEAIKQTGSTCLQALKTSEGNELLDYWLLLKKKKLPLFSGKILLQPVFASTEPLQFPQILEKIKCIGTGAFSKVFLARHLKSGQLFAVKTLNKEHIISLSKENEVLEERDIWVHCDHNRLVKLNAAFQTEFELHFVMEFCPGGEFFPYIQRYGGFSEQTAKFYFAEVLLAIEYLHEENIIIRDLKPENMVVDIDGHIKLTDFGSSKFLRPGESLCYTFCGSPEYFSPEMKKNEGHDFSLDIYSLGMFLHEMVAGFPPSTDSSDPNQAEISLEHLSLGIEDLLCKLLQPDPERRIGIEGIKEHPWCEDIPWTAIRNEEIRPPLKLNPKLSYIDPAYTELPITPFSGNLLWEDPIFPNFNYKAFENLKPGLGREAPRSEKIKPVKLLEKPLSSSSLSHITPIKKLTEISNFSY